MPTELIQLYQDLNKESLRIRRPSKFIFFCGGTMNGGPNVSCSLRHYLLHERQIGKRIKADIVLAEKANQLYRDTFYSDLITFEEDIARISAMVFLIAESAGSLAELGAFAAIDAIRSNLAVVIQTEHEQAESFVRYGPIEKMKNEDERRIGVYPWRVNKAGRIIKASVVPHVPSMIRFVNGLLKRTPNEELFGNNIDTQIFIVILWILYLSQAIAITELHRYTSAIINISINDLKNKLFCMQLAGWVDKYTYESKTYWFSRSQLDPFSRYSFIAGVINDTGRRKTTVATSIHDEIRVPKHVRTHVAAIKKATSP